MKVGYRKRRKKEKSSLREIRKSQRDYGNITKSKFLASV